MNEQIKYLACQKKFSNDEQFHREKAQQVKCLHYGNAFEAELPTKRQQYWYRKHKRFERTGI